MKEGELLIKNVCGLFEKEGGRETVLGVSGVKVGEAGGPDFLVEKGCGEVEALLRGEDGFLGQDLEDGRVGD